MSATTVPCWVCDTCATRLTVIAGRLDACPDCRRPLRRVADSQLITTSEVAK